MKISISLIKKENEFIANCPELDINCYGANKNEAIRRIKSVIHFYIDSAKELGLNVDSLDEITVEGHKDRDRNNSLCYQSSETIN
ncbi:MAG: hypothetical protein GY754_13015 [bacterium]|nr:hypothetical protein [bacterium]